MSIAEWVAVITLIGVVVASWGTVLLKLATLNTRLKSIETNHLPTLARRLEKLPCQLCREENVKLTIRLEAVVDRLEKVEMRSNSK